MRGEDGHLVEILRADVCAPSPFVVGLHVGQIKDAALFCKGWRHHDGHLGSGDGFARFVEYLAAAGQSGDWALTGGVRSLLHSRLGGVTQTGAQLLGAAAAIGRSFDFDTLKEASGRTEEEVVTGLEELMSQGLVRQVGRGEKLHQLRPVGGVDVHVEPGGELLRAFDLDQSPPPAALGDPPANDRRQRGGDQCRHGGLIGPAEQPARMTSKATAVVLHGSVNLQRAPAGTPPGTWR